MGNKLYVGNLPYSVRDEDLQQSFGQFGAVFYLLAVRCRLARIRAPAGGDPPVTFRPHFPGVKTAC